LFVNASNIDKDWNHIAKYNEKFGAKMTNASDEMSLIAIQGPKATEILQKLTETDLSPIPLSFHHRFCGWFFGCDYFEHRLHRKWRI
jgi:glycine cleavage system aminomethyltransferase T